MGVAQVGPTYGRKTMQGLLAAGGVRASQRRVARSLRNVAPGYHHCRRAATARQTNPVPYNVDYFGHKLHIDQNEKLVMYGVTHYAAIDGYSGMVVSFITMPIKNPIDIYEHLFR